MTIELRDSRGRAVPVKKRKPQKHTVNILLPWRMIQTVIMFEDKDGEDLEIDDEALGADEQKGRIGFIK